MGRSLDVPERQALVYYSGDRVPWHHRLLFERVAGSRWVVASPTMDAQIEDLGESEDLRPLGRDEELPDDCRSVYHFDDLSASDLQDLRARGRRMADLLGVVPVAGVEGDDSPWLFADPSHERFAEFVGRSAWPESGRCSEARRASCRRTAPTSIHGSS